MRAKITKRDVDPLKPQSRRVFLWGTEVTGFGCRVTPACRNVYLLHYGTEGQDSPEAQKRITWSWRPAA